VADAPLQGRSAVFAQLVTLYGAGGLHNDVLHTATMIAQRLESKTVYPTWFQRLFLGTSAFIVVMEAVFVFWPVQYTI
jgi:hypothetical protein